MRKLLNHATRHKFLLLTALLIVCGFVAYRHFSYNDTQRKAEFLNQYVKTQHFVKLSSYSSTPGFGSDATLPSYGAYYKTTTSTQAVKNSLKSYLQAHGYWTKEVLHTPPCSHAGCPEQDGVRPINDGKPYWTIDAGNNYLLIVATITDKSYIDTSAGEVSNPSGYNVISFYFAEPGTNPNWY